MAREVWEEDDLAPVCSDHRSFRRSLGCDLPLRRPVPALGINGRLQCLDQLPGCRFLEYHHPIYTLQGLEQCCSLFLWDDWAPGSFEEASGIITVEPHHQQVAKGPSLLQVVHVPPVQEVEMPIGEDDAIAPSLQKMALGL